jgi:hypothetical protein
MRRVTWSRSKELVLRGLQGCSKDAHVAPTQALYSCVVWAYGLYLKQHLQLLSQPDIQGLQDIGVLVNQVEVPWSTTTTPHSVV